MNSYWIAHASAQKITKSMKMCNSFKTNRIHFKTVRRQSEMTHQQQVNCSGSAVTERAIGQQRQRPPLAFVML